MAKKNDLDMAFTSDQCFKLAGAVKMGKLLCSSGDSWTMMACVDYLVEIGELSEMKYGTGPCAAQNRIFI